MVLTFDAHDDAIGIDRIDDAVAPGQNHCARVTRSHAFHSRANDGRLRAQQRHGLALHVRAHQRAIGVVVLEERNQRCGHRYQLLGADVDVIDFVAADQHEVAGLAGIDQLGHNLALVVELHVGLRNGVPVLFPRGKIEGERIDLRRLLALLFKSALIFSISCFSM